MINEIKLGLKLIKYGYKIKMNVIMAIIILVVGIAVEIGSKGTNLIGGFYLMIMGMFVYQMIISNDVSTYVQTSPLKRSLQLSVPVFTSTVIYAAIYTILLVERIILINKMPENKESLLITLSTIVCFMMITFIFSAICYKYFLAGFICFMALLVIGMYNFIYFWDMGLGDFIMSLSFGMIALIGYATILIGGLAEYGIGVLMYKHDLSEYAFRGVFKEKF